MIDNNETLELLCRLIDIPSTFPKEKEALLFLEQYLTSNGFECGRTQVAPDRWNIHVRTGSGNPVVCLNAHSDTVPPNGKSTPQARSSDDKILGLGSCDTKASVASMVTALMELRETPPCTVDLLISADEEGNGLGVRKAIEQGYRCDYAIVGEPTSLNVVRAHSGVLFFDLSTAGVSTHGCAPWNGVSAIEEMMKLVNGLREQVDICQAHPLVGPPSLNLGAIYGGDRPNRVPDSCKALIDIRVPPPGKTAELFSRLEPVLQPFISKGGCFKIIKQHDSLSTPEDSILVQSVHKAASMLTGGRSEVAGLRGWTEAESFQTLLGIDAVVFGPGNLVQAHSADEFVLVDEVKKASLVYVEAVRELAGRVNGG